MTITVRYSAVDGFRKTRTFKTLAGARKFAVERVGSNPELGRTYAVSFDGIGKVEVEGCTVAELFAQDVVVNPAEFTADEVDADLDAQCAIDSAAVDAAYAKAKASNSEDDWHAHYMLAADFNWRWQNGYRAS
jgi:hypothetical protein